MVSWLLLGVGEREWWMMGCLRTMIVKVPRWLPGDGEIEREGIA